MSQDQVILQVKALQALRQQIQMNSFGLPTGFYRVDMLPFHDYEPTSSVPLAPAPASAPALVELELELEIEPELETELNQASASAIGFDPITREPLSYIDTSERCRSHPLIIPGVSTEPITELTVCRIAGFMPDDLHTAFVELDYAEGFPTFENGDAFWSQLCYEPYDAFNAFRKYLQMSGATSDRTTLDADAVEGATGVRSIADLSLSMTNGISQGQIKQWSELYYWEWRSRAYDIFRVVQHRQQQEIRAIETQDSHYISGRRLQARAMEFINSEDFADMLSPKVALDALRLGANMERVSAGLPLNGPAVQGQSTVVSARATLQQVVNGSYEEVDLGEGTSLILDQALTDPEQAESLQSLILQVQVSS